MGKCRICSDYKEKGLCKKHNKEITKNKKQFVKLLSKGGAE